MSNTTYQKDRDVILNRAKDYYENNKERLRGLANNKYRNLSEEDKNKRKKNMEKTDIIICLKKKTEIKRISKKLSLAKKVLI